MSQVPLRPHLVVSDAQGNIYDHPTLLMLCRTGMQWGFPRQDELMPLPPESELFYLPKRRAVGLDSQSGQLQVLEDLAVAAFAAPAHTLTAHPAYESDKDAPLLPLFAYGAVGFANDRFYICAKKVDNDQRQEFRKIKKSTLTKNVLELANKYPNNRLMQHILHKCVLRYDCPAARNLALGRHEAPLPTSRTCNARCIGCISQQEEGSPIVTTPQCRLDFCPTPDEIVQVMQHHAKQETKKPIFSFGQGCEGEPLTNAHLLQEAIEIYRKNNGRGTINLNSNASYPKAIENLAKAGLTSLRVSINSAREQVYTAYYRPCGYTLDDVKSSMVVAREHNVHVSLNLLYFPGITDTEEELTALINLVGTCSVSLIQLRNLNIDPEMYLNLLKDIPMGPCVGFSNFKKRLRKACPWVTFGYFNPWLGDKATIKAPMPNTWEAKNYNNLHNENNDKHNNEVDSDNL